MSVDDYLPKEWLGFPAVAHREWVKENPGQVRRSVRAILEGIDFIRKNPGWTIEKMKLESGLPEEGARIIYQDLKRRYTQDGKITRQAMENVRNFFIDYGLVQKERVPPTEELFTDSFTK